jgi:hypothetical protein
VVGLVANRKFGETRRGIRGLAARQLTHDGYSTPGLNSVISGVAFDNAA